MTPSSSHGRVRRKNGPGSHQRGRGSRAHRDRRHEKYLENPAARPDRILTARRAQARELPASLPATDVESLRIFGTSWYTRGLSYYLRRVLISLLFLCMLAFAVTCAGAIVLGFAGSSPVARTVWALIVGVVILASFIWPLRDLRRRQDRRRAGQLVYPEIRSGGFRISTGETRLGTGTRWLITLGGTFSVMIGSVIFFGWYVILFLESFRPEYGVEHDARLRMQQRARWTVLRRTHPSPGRKR